MKNHFALDGLELEHPEPESIELDSHWLKIIIPIHSFLDNHFAFIGMMEQLLERERLNFESIEMDSHWLKIIIPIHSFLNNHFALDGLELEHPEPESIELDSHWLKIIILITLFWVIILPLLE